LALASAIQYKVTIQAEATVRPSGELRLVQSAIEGSVTRILAKEHQSVKRGDVIAMLDDSQLQTKKSQLQSNVRQAQLQLLQIDAQFQAIDRQITAETNRNRRAVASAQAELSLREKEHQEKRTIVNADLQEAEANFKQAMNELQKVEAEFRSTEANLRSAEAAAKVARTKRSRYHSLTLAGALSQEQLEEAILADEQHKQAVESEKAAVQAHKKTIERQGQAVAAARARWQKTKAGLNPSLAGVEIAAEQIAQENASGEATLATLEKEQEVLNQQRIQISQQLERDTRELQQVAIDLSRTTLRATADGILSHLNLRNSGQTVRLGEQIAQIVPLDAPLEVKAEVSPKDISKLAKGQKVQMRVSACPYPDYGTLKGVVRHISQDTIQPQDKSSGVAAFYEVTIGPESLVLGKIGNQCAIQLGMEGRADIITREETVLKFFLRKVRLSADF
jgi:multidrug efflux pump subunit AcrA (membrane-fusion protein)